MHASAIIAPGDGTYTVETIEIGPPGPGEVLVALKAAGLCHTDWDFMRYGQPLIPGHEGAGVIEALGPGVTGLQPGDWVLLNWAIPCGACFQCRRGNQHLCEINPRSPRSGPCSGGSRFGACSGWARWRPIPSSARRP